jgi:hypothetical protein
MSHEDLYREIEWIYDRKWSSVHGTEGWWQILTYGIWVDGARIFKNQQIILDAGPFQTHKYHLLIYSLIQLS